MVICAVLVLLVPDRCYRNVLDQLIVSKRRIIEISFDDHVMCVRIVIKSSFPLELNSECV